MSQAGRELSAPAGTRLPEVDPSHQASQPGRAANFSRGTAPATLLGKTLGFCLCTRESCSAGAPSTTGDVSVSRGPALMPSCVAGDESTLYSLLSIPAGLTALPRSQEMLPFAAPHPAASNPGQNPARGAANTTRPLFLAWKASKLVLLGCWAMNMQLLELSQSPELGADSPLPLDP